MDEYIKKDAVLSIIDTLILKQQAFKKSPVMPLIEIKSIIEKMQPENAVRVVRCENCVYYRPNSIYDREICTRHYPSVFTNANHYCGYGKIQTK